MADRILPLAAVSKSILMGTVFTEVTKEERLEIIKALDFGYTGHLSVSPFFPDLGRDCSLMLTHHNLRDRSYTCPNGHPYIITECGGAQQVSQCPDCGSRIGGSGHTLIGDNARDTVMEDLARQTGTARSPWAWGQ